MRWSKPYISRTRHSGHSTHSGSNPFSCVITGKPAVDCLAAALMKGERWRDLHARILEMWSFTNLSPLICTWSWYLMFHLHIFFLIWIIIPPYLPYQWMMYDKHLKTYKPWMQLNCTFLWFLCSKWHPHLIVTRQEIPAAASYCQYGVRLFWPIRSKTMKSGNYTQPNNYECVW